jgi:hypothetical protein
LEFSSLCQASAASSVTIPSNPRPASNTCLLNDASVDSAATEDLSGLLSQLRATTRVIRRIPKGARLAVAEEYSKVVNRCVSQNTTDSWKHLLLFVYSTLSLSKDLSATCKVSLTTLVKRNLSDQSIKRINDCVREPLQKKRNSSSMAKLVESRLAEGDVRGAIRVLSSEDTLAPVDAVTLQTLRDKHPRGSSTAIFPPSSDKVSAACVTSEEIAAAVQSFSCGFAGGVNGLRPQHLKNLLSKANGDTERNFNKKNNLTTIEFVLEACFLGL